MTLSAPLWTHVHTEPWKTLIWRKVSTLVPIGLDNVRILSIFLIFVHTLCPGLICLTFCEKMQFRNKGFGNYSNRDIKKFIPNLKKTTTTIIIATTKTKTKADKFEALAPISFRAVTKILSCRVNTTSRRGIKQLEISFGSIFLPFSYESSRGPRS